MVRTFQMCCIFFIGITFILGASRSAPPPPTQAHSESYAPSPPEWARHFPNG